jgi:hypothetical protein
VGRVLRTLGFTPQRPLHRAWQQDKVLVERWEQEEYPKIRKRSKKEKALIYFGDESGIRSDYHAGTTWGERDSGSQIYGISIQFEHDIGGQRQWEFSVYDSGRFCER